MSLFSISNLLSALPDYSSGRMTQGTLMPNGEPDPTSQNPMLAMMQMIMQAGAAQTEAALKPRGKISTDPNNTFGRVGRQPGKSGLETWAAMNPGAPKGQEAIDASRGGDYKRFRGELKKMNEFVAKNGRGPLEDQNSYQRGTDPFTAAEMDYQNSINSPNPNPYTSAAAQSALERMRQIDPVRAARFIGGGSDVPGSSYDPRTGQPMQKFVAPKAVPVAGANILYPPKGPTYGDANIPQAMPVTGEVPGAYANDTPPRAQIVEGAPIIPPPVDALSILADSVLDESPTAVPLTPLERAKARRNTMDVSGKPIKGKVLPPPPKQPAKKQKPLIPTGWEDLKRRIVG